MVNKSFLKHHVREIIIFFIFLLSILIICGLVFIPEGKEDIFFGHPEELNYSRNIIINQSFLIHEPNDKYKQEFRISFIDYSLYVPETFDFNFSEICFGKLLIIVKILNHGVNNSISFVSPNLCHNIEEAFVTTLVEENTKVHKYLINLDEQRDIYDFFVTPPIERYPFDGFVAEVEIDNSIILRNSNHEFQIPEGSIINTVNIKFQEEPISSLFPSLNWSISKYVQQDNPHGRSVFIEPGAFGLYFGRTVYNILLVIIPIVVIFIFEWSLLFVKSLSTFIEGSVGIFFGLFGLKSFIFPYDTNQMTIIDNFIMFLFIMFLIIMIAFISFRLIARIRGDEKYSPHNLFK